MGGHTRESRAGGSGGGNGRSRGGGFVPATLLVAPPVAPHARAPPGGPRLFVPQFGAFPSAPGEGLGSPPASELPFTGDGGGFREECSR